MAEFDKSSKPTKLVTGHSAPDNPRFRISRSLTKPFEGLIVEPTQEDANAYVDSQDLLVGTAQPQPKKKKKGFFAKLFGKR